MKNPMLGEFREPLEEDNFPNSNYCSSALSGDEALREALCCTFSNYCAKMSKKGSFLRDGFQ